MMASAAATTAASPPPRPRPEEQENDDDATARATRRPRVLLGVSGSVAAIKAPLVCERLLRFADVRVVLTNAARHFLPPVAAPYGAPPPVSGDDDGPPPEDDGTFGFPAAAQPVLLDAQEWRDWRRVGDPVAHIELRRWADVLVVAPLSANTLSKMAAGGCDNLLTCVARAWDTKGSAPVLVAPAMNTAMWESPFTGEHLAVLKRVLGARAVAPAASKTLACGDVGAGAMAAPGEIAREVARALVARGFAGEEVARAAAGEAGD